MAASMETQGLSVMETKMGRNSPKIPISAHQLPITGCAHNAGIVGDMVVATLGATGHMPAKRLGAASFNRPLS